MKLKTAINYRLRYQLKSGSIFFGCYFLFCILLPVTIFIIVGTTKGATSDASVAPCIFLIILSFIGITSDFKLFIQNSMSRANIFLASIISNFLLAFCMICAVFVIKTAVSLFTTNFQVSLFLADLYVKNNGGETFVLSLVFLLVASSLGTLIGICSDSRSNITQLSLLGILTVLPTLLILLLKIASPKVLAILFDFLKDIVGITDTGFHILPLMTLLLVCYLCFTVITYLLNRRREIKRINR